MIVFLNGEFMIKEECKITPFNSSYLFGNGIFETFRVFDGKIILLGDHLERLNKSLAFFKFKPVSYEHIEKIINNLVELNNLPTARIKISISKDFLNRKENLLIDIEEYRRTFPEFARVMVNPDKLIHGDLIRMHKTTNYLKNEFALEEAKASNYDEAIFIDELNHLIEGTRTNVFIVTGGKVFTPALDCGVLPGITRKFILQSAKELEIQVQEKIILIDELLQSDEIFLTNSINGIIKVKQLNERIINDFNISDRIKVFYQNKLGII